MPEAAEPVFLTEIVTVRAQATAEAAVAVTVTEVANAASATLDGVAVRVTAGWASSSVSVIAVPLTVKVAPADSGVPSIEIDSVSSTDVSLVGVRANEPVAVVAFAARVMLNAGTTV